MLERDVPAEHDNAIALWYELRYSIEVFYFRNDLLLVSIINFIHSSCPQATRLAKFHNDLVVKKNRKIEHSPSTQPSPNRFRYVSSDKETQDFKRATQKSQIFERQGGGRLEYNKKLYGCHQSFNWATQIFIILFGELNHHG